MRALRLYPQGLVLEEVARPEPGPGEVLVTGDRGRLDADVHLARTRLGPRVLLQHESLRVQP